MYFVGVDLAWSPRRTSAVAVASGGLKEALLRGWQANLSGIAEVAGFIERATGGSPTLIAVDAPLAVPNVSGMRRCDRVVTSLFRSYKAGVHPVNRSNLSRYQGFQGEALAQDLLRRRYVHGIRFQPREPLKAFFETYPHAASIVLFHLPERLRYKARGSSRQWDVRREAFREYQRHLRGLRRATPAMRIEDEILQQRLDELKGGRRKSYEDLLDSILCAYISYYYWYWGASKCVVLGTVEDGYVVLPGDDDLRRRLDVLSEGLGHQDLAQ